MTNSIWQRARRRFRRERYQRAVSNLSNQEFTEFFARHNNTRNDWPFSLEFHADEGLFEIKDQTPEHASLKLARSSRIELYHKGVAGRLDHLWKEYLVDEIDLNPGDLVVDIGANIGEFSLAAQRLGANTFAIEPDPTEFRALSANCNNSNVLNCALWNEAGELTFYCKNDSGDSSLIEIPDYSEKITVPAKTLNEVYREQLNTQPIKLLKIEAEGAEPEIIAAADEALARAEYVTVDVGPERGLAQENTVAPVLNALSTHGFQLRRFGNVRFVMLLSR